MPTIRKDGKAYDGGDVVIDLLGAQAYEVEDISYSTKQDHQLNYALGSNEPRTWSRGKKSFEASMTVAMTEGVQFEKVAPNRDLMAIPPFDINVSFVNEFNDIINDTVTCKFQNQGREVQGEMGLKFKYDLFVLGVKFNNA
jgi:hypothetical protein